MTDPTPDNSGHRLESWKEIAAYLGRDVRTVQRWEKNEGLPVHRLQHRRRATPYCYPDELATWLARRTTSNGNGHSVEKATVPTGRRFPRWARAPVLGMVLVLAVGIPLFLRGDEAQPVPRSPTWILVAEFDSPPDEPELGIMARELVTTSLGNSDLVSPVSQAEIHRAMQRALKPDLEVRGEVARELAIRANAPTFVEGRVDRVADNYSLCLKLLDSDTGRHLESVQAMSRGREELIPTLDRMARELRSRIGDRQDDIQATREFHDVITPSLEAYLLYVQACRTADRQRNWVEGKRLLHKALDIDPRFARAWFVLGAMYWNAGEPDSSLMAIERAIANKERLTPSQLEHAYAAIAARRKDPLTAVRHLRRALSMNPPAGDRASLLNLLWIELSALDRKDEALDAIEQAVAARALAPDEIVLRNLFLTYLGNDLPERAEAVLPRMAPSTRRLCERDLALLRSEWERAATLLRAGEKDETRSPDMRCWERLALASTFAGRGELQEFVATSKTTVEGMLMHAQFSELARAILDQETGVPLRTATSPPANDATVPSWVMDAFTRTVLGDAAAAREALHRVEEFAPEVRKPNEPDIALLRALVLVAEGEASAAAALAPFADSGPGLHSGRLPVRWLLGRVYERTGQSRQAIQAYESIFDHIGTDFSDWWVFRGVLVPLAHARLVELYAQIGDQTRSEDHLAKLTNMWTEPDEVARQVLSKLQGRITSR